VTTLESSYACPSVSSGRSEVSKATNLIVPDSSPKSPTCEIESLRGSHRSTSSTRRSTHCSSSSISLTRTDSPAAAELVALHPGVFEVAVGDAPTRLVEGDAVLVDEVFQSLLDLVGADV